MATSGGLEIHQQLSHAAPTPKPEPAFEAVPASAGVSAARVGEVPPIVRPRERSAWPKVPALALAVAMLLLAGVASALVKSRGPSALSLVQEAAATTSDAKTARVS